MEEESSQQTIADSDFIDLLSTLITGALFQVSLSLLDFASLAQASGLLQRNH